MVSPSGAAGALSAASASPLLAPGSLGTLSGALGFVLSIPEKTYQILSQIQALLTLHTEHSAGLNPFAYRFYKPSYPMVGNSLKGILDLRFLWKFYSLPIFQRRKMAMQAGTTESQILQLLQEIEYMSALL